MDINFGDWQWWVWCYNLDEMIMLEWIKCNDGHYNYYYNLFGDCWYVVLQ